MGKKSFKEKLSYIICCSLLYLIVALISSILPVNMKAEGVIYFQLMGRIIAMCYFATVIIRNILIFKFHITRDYGLSKINFETVITFICTVFGTIVVALIWQTKDLNNLSDDLRINIPTLYFVSAWITTIIGTKVNSNTNLFNYYCWQEKKTTPIKDISIFMLLWIIPVILLSIIFKNSMNIRNVVDNKYTLIIYLVPYIYVIIVSYLFAKFNKRHSWNINDMDEYGYSYSAFLYNDVFKLELHFIIFLISSIVTNLFVKIPDYCYIILSFIISCLMIPIINHLSFNGRFSIGPDGKRYKISPISSNFTNCYKEEKDEKGRPTFEFESSYIKDEFGNIIGKATSVTNNWAGIKTTEYKDKMGNSKGSNTTIKW